MTDEIADSIRSAELEPAAVARLIAQTPDSELRKVLRGEVREAALDRVFERMREFVDSERISDVEAVVEWLIDGDRRLMVIERGTCRAQRDSAGDSRVTLELDAVDFLRLVTGNADPGILFLTGALRLRGDERFAVEMASFFRIPSADGEARSADAAIDPALSDPAEFAGVVRDTPDERLREVMGSTIREVILDEVFRRFPEYVQPAQARRVQAVIEWRIGGRPGGGHDRYMVEIDRGEVRTGPEVGGKPRLTLRMDGVDFLKLVTGNANPTMSFVRGRLKIGGDLVFAAQLPGIFRIPTAGG